MFPSDLNAQCSASSGRWAGGGMGEGGNLTSGGRLSFRWDLDQLDMDDDDDDRWEKLFITRRVRQGTKRAKDRHMLSPSVPTKH